MHATTPGESTSLALSSTSDGVVVVRGGQRQILRDDQIVGLRTRVQHSRGWGGETDVVQSVDLCVRSDAHNEWMTVASDVRLLEDDAARQLHDRVLQGLIERNWRALCAGEEVQGGGWSLSLSGFTDTTSGLTVTPQEIARAGWCGDEFCIWHEDRAAAADEPLLRIPRSANNVELLPHLLGGLSPQSLANHETPATIGLGRRLDAIALRSEKQLVRWLWIAVATLFMLLAGTPWTPGLIVGGLLVWLSIGLIFLPRLQRQEEVLEHFERGLVWRYGSSEVLLWFDQITSFAAQWPRETTPTSAGRVVFRFGLQRDQSLAFELCVPLSGRSEQRQQVESVQAHVVSVLADRLRGELDRHGRAAWTSRLTIVPEGLEYQATPVQASERFAFRDVESWQLTPSELRLTLRDGRLTVVQSAGDINFYPGLLLVRLLSGVSF